MRTARGQPTSLDDAFEPSLRSRPGDLDDGGPGTFTTVCVRLCDGYYWPVHHAARRRDFQRAARSCEASCGEDARLFTMPNRGAGGIDTAVDLQGRPYSKLPTALFYRKTLINGCACKPAPWSPTEAARHGEYAAAELAARRAVQEALAADTVAPMGSFRAAQEIGRPRTAVQIAVGRRRDTVADADGTIDIGVGAGPADPMPAMRKTRTARPARVDGAIERPRAPQRTEPRSPQVLAAGPTSSPQPAVGFKPFAASAAGKYKWPGD